MLLGNMCHDFDGCNIFYIYNARVAIDDESLLFLEFTASE